MSNPKPAPNAAPPYVKRSQSGGVLTLSLNRGESFNPLSSAMIGSLESAFDEAAEDSSVRVIVLRGEGRGFCAGHDLRELREFGGDAERQKLLFDSCSRMMLKMAKLPQPVIARVHGIATAAGCQLVSMCDLAVADESARFGLPGVNIGLFCSTPAVGVARNIGRKRSMEMLLTGDTIDAATALAWGLINRAVSSEKLDDEVQRFADRILARSGAAIALGKGTFYSQIESSSHYAYCVAGAAMTSNLQFDDAAEGIDAFLAKRPAQWRNS
ncbi:MAG TPA: enoyl-CoA hydratase [Steroidobacteraceae bacterium]|nr:enoyl-CoA hydratase [Steroidobacteraceae bacterium]